MGSPKTTTQAMVDKANKLRSLGLSTKDIGKMMGYHPSKISKLTKFKTVEEYFEDKAAEQRKWKARKRQNLRSSISKNIPKADKTLEQLLDDVLENSNKILRHLEQRTWKDRILGR